MFASFSPMKHPIVYQTVQLNLLMLQFLFQATKPKKEEAHAHH